MDALNLHLPFPWLVGLLVPENPFATRLISMGDTSNSHTNYRLGGVVSGVAQIGSHLIGETIIDFLRRNFTRDGRLQHGDIYVDQSRILLQRHLSLMDRDDQNTIRKKYIDLMSLRGNLGSPQLWAANFILGTEYKRKCKKTYLIVEDASNRAVNDTLMAQMNEAIGESWFAHLFLELILTCIFEVIPNRPAILLSILVVPRY
ncbi:hypothetical protein BC826DRAFT_317151 [Russula brevipes]|nr:hypothetical protein BC826DRAFT_317151 [Russula brevipes]